MTDQIAFPRDKIPGEVYRFLSLDKDHVTYKPMLYVSGESIATNLPFLG